MPDPKEALQTETDAEDAENTDTDSIPTVLSSSAVVDLTDNLPDAPEIETIRASAADMMSSDVTFASLDLPEPLLRSIEDLKFVRCTPIQAQALPFTLKGRDITGQAQTGTGKTAAFLITIFKELLETERLHPSAPRAVVVAPTRELAIQIAEDGVGLSHYTDFNIVPVYGGMDWEKQARDLEHPVDVLVGTPGRMMDYMRRGLVSLANVQVVVIDEADRMFDMGFVDDIRYIMSHCSRDRQTLLFSATFPFEVARLARRFLTDPVDIQIEPDQIAAASVEQELYHVSGFEKLNFMLWLLEEEKPRKALTFVNTKRTGEWLQFKLYHNGWDAEYISGDIAQKKRLRLIEGFKKGDIELLVATDVAARGLHVDDVDIVINFDLPSDAQDYVHRIGRTGRAGNKGRAVSIADEQFVASLVDIERYIGRRIKASAPDDTMFLSDQSPSYGEHRRSRGRGDGRRSGGFRSGSDRNSSRSGPPRTDGRNKRRRNRNR